jgi:hypothetical protein
MCDRCHKNFCLRHRHEMDHSCQGFDNTGRSVTNQGLVIYTIVKPLIYLKLSFSARTVKQLVTVDGARKKAGKPPTARETLVLSVTYLGSPECSQLYEHTNLFLLEVWFWFAFSECSFASAAQGFSNSYLLRYNLLVTSIALFAIV